MTKVIQHKKAMDVAFAYTSLKKYNNTIILKGYWINLGYTGQPWTLMTDRLKLKSLDDWIDITEIYQHPRPTNP